MDYFDTAAEHAAFYYSTASEWDRAEALEVGAEYPSQAWILTDRDVWHKNPFYTGPDVPHPEDDPEHWAGRYDPDLPYLLDPAFDYDCDSYRGPF
jgi:hypothetical protein